MRKSVRQSFKEKEDQQAQRHRENVFRGLPEALVHQLISRLQTAIERWRSSLLFGFATLGCHVRSAFISILKSVLLRVTASGTSIVKSSHP
jgi:hypothetical protein